MSNITRIPARSPRTLKADLQVTWTMLSGTQMREVLTVIWFAATSCLLLALLAS